MTFYMFRTVFMSITEV